MKKEKHDACPNCGACPHCGRGGYHFVPYIPYIPYVPYMQTYPWVSPQTTWTIGTFKDTSNTYTVTSLASDPLTS